MRSLLRPIAFCAGLVFGAGPAATIACELACSSASGHGHHQGSGHEHSSAVAQTATPIGTLATVGTRASKCEHDVVGDPALVTPAAVKVFAPVALNVLVLGVIDTGYARIIAGANSTVSPPGKRSGPLPLRI